MTSPGGGRKRVSPARVTRAGLSPRVEPHHAAVRAPREHEAVYRVANEGERLVYLYFAVQPALSVSAGEAAASTLRRAAALPPRGEPHPHPRPRPRPRPATRPRPRGRPADPPRHQPFPAGPAGLRAGDGRRRGAQGRDRGLARPHCPPRPRPHRQGREPPHPAIARPAAPPRASPAAATRCRSAGFRAWRAGSKQPQRRGRQARGRLAVRGATETLGHRAQRTGSRSLPKKPKEGGSVRTAENRQGGSAPWPLPQGAKRHRGGNVRIHGREPVNRWPEPSAGSFPADRSPSARESAPRNQPTPQVERASSGLVHGFSSSHIGSRALDIRPRPRRTTTPAGDRTGRRRAAGRGESRTPGPPARSASGPPPGGGA